MFGFWFRSEQIWISSRTYQWWFLGLFHLNKPVSARQVRFTWTELTWTTDQVRYLTWTDLKWPELTWPEKTDLNWTELKKTGVFRSKNGRFGGVLGRFWGVFGAFWGVLGRFWAFWGVFWAFLGVYAGPKNATPFFWPELNWTERTTGRYKFFWPELNWTEWPDFSSVQNSGEFHMKISPVGRATGGPC